MPASLQKSVWSPKICDICGERKNLELLGDRIYQLPTREGPFEFILKDTLCLSCGFAFTGEIPDDRFLDRYYRAAHTLRSDIHEIKPDFDPDARLEIIRKYVKPGGSVCEIGAASGEFCELLNDEGFTASGLDPLAKCSESVAETGIFRSTGNLDGSIKSFDAVVGYYVLEHITRPRLWLDHIKNFLSLNGILIIEVPHFTRNPVESLYPQHMLHFTPHHLRLLLESMGFGVLLIEEQKISRKFGFVAAAMLTAPDKNLFADPDAVDREDLESIVESGRHAYKQGIETKYATETRFRKLAEYLEVLSAPSPDSKSKVYFWPANDVATAVASAMKDTTDVIAVDSSATKIGTLYPGFPNPVQAPVFPKDDDRHRIFILCSPSWNSQIADQIREMDLDDISIIDAVSWKELSAKEQ